MKSDMEAILDRLEGIFTKPNKPNKRWKGRPPPVWVTWTSPEVNLKPNEPYSLRLYIRAASVPLLFVLTLITLAYCTALVVGWSTFRKLYAFLHTPHHTVQGQHSAIILYSFIFLCVVALPVLWAAAVFAIPFPRYYFWNRRAKRLQSQAELREAVPVQGVLDTAVWPPSPKKPI